MRFLLDTHFLLWTAEESDRLPAEFIKLVEDSANELYFSVASIWEVAIKVRRRPNCRSSKIFPAFTVILSIACS